MRTIKFRGQSEDDKKWTFGDLITNKGLPYIMNGVVEANEEWITLEEWQPVRLETVGQFTGIKDKNGVDIYEGDILRVNTKIVVCEDDDLFGENKLTDQEITCYVSYTEKFAAFELITLEEDRFLKAWGFYGEEDSEDFEVIGSIHSNPELIK